MRMMSMHTLPLKLDFILILHALVLAQREVMSQEMRCIGRRRRVWHVPGMLGHWFRFWWRLRHGPHVHCDGPVGLDHGLPDLGEDDFAVGADEIVVPFVDVRANNVDVEEGLLNEFFHALVDS